MRLKKSKEPETKKSQQYDGITRLVCTSKSQNNLLSGRFNCVVTAYAELLDKSPFRWKNFLSIPKNVID